VDLYWPLFCIELDSASHAHRSGQDPRPPRPNAVKHQVYECGVETFGDTRVQFRAQYYIFALVFVLFDVELVFLFPWALAYNQLGLFALFEMTVFIFLLVVALVYTWRKGALTWA